MGRARVEEKCFEIRLENGQVIRGVLHDAPNKQSPVVMVHGYFSSNKYGPARLYVQISRVIASSGFPVIRFDAIGFGDSDGEIHDTTPESMVRDTLAVINHYRALGYGPRFVLLGHSFGCNLSAIIAETDKAVKSLIVIAPVCEKGSKIRYFDQDQLDELHSRGFTFRKGFLTSEQYVRAINEALGMNAACNLGIPVTVIQGQEDEFYSTNGGKELAKSCKNGRYIPIKKGDHNFMHPIARLELLYALQPSIQSA